MEALQLNNKAVMEMGNSLEGVYLKKQPGGRNVKDCIDSYEDMKRIYAHLIEKKRWNIYLLFVLNYNLSRRIGDLLAAKWSDFFDENWKMRKFWSLTEKKTKKKNDIKLNKAVRIGFKTFLTTNEHLKKQMKITMSQYLSSCMEHIKVKLFLRKVIDSLLKKWKMSFN